MSRILGRVPSSLASLLDIEGGRVLVSELRDSEGVSLVYDISRLVDVETLALTTRAFDTGAMAASATVDSLIIDLPQAARILGVDVGTDVSARLAQCSMFLEDVGGFVSAPARDHMLWEWLAGGLARAAPVGGVYTTGDLAATEVLYPSTEFRQGIYTQVPYIDRTGPQRTGASRVHVTTTATAFGAGTVRVSGHLLMLFSLGFSGRGTTLLPLG